MTHNEEQKGGVYADHVEDWKMLDGERKTEVITATSEEIQGGKMKEEKPRN